MKLRLVEKEKKQVKYEEDRKEKFKIRRKENKALIIQPSDDEDYEEGKGDKTEENIKKEQ